VRLRRLKIIESIARPPEGWLRSIREALGMTMAQLARRLDVSQPRIVAIERAEVSGAISLATLERAAEALGCSLVYALVPRASLEKTVEERAGHLAEKQWQLRATLPFGGAALKSSEEQVWLRRWTRSFVARGGAKLWNDD
jgi:predicted DNA-binding mobile mystery protein A